MELEELDQKKLGKSFKTSQKRALVVSYFLKEDRHFTVEELYHEIKRINPRISYSTVYRALRLLTKLGLANIDRFGGNEVRFEPVHKNEHHDHLVCSKCGRIVEFTDKNIEKHIAEVASEHEFFIESYGLTIYGLCKECQQNEKNAIV